MLNAIDLARYVVARTNKIAHGVNRLQLEQMLYFIQAEFLVAFDKPCFADDIEACELGIKIRTVRREFTVYAAGRIWYYDEVKGIGNSVSTKQCKKCCGFGSILRSESYAEYTENEETI